MNGEDGLTHTAVFAGVTVAEELRVELRVPLASQMEQGNLVAILQEATAPSRSASMEAASLIEVPILQEAIAPRTPSGSLEMQAPDLLFEDEDPGADRGDGGRPQLGEGAWLRSAPPPLAVVEDMDSLRGRLFDTMTGAAASGKLESLIESILLEVDDPDACELLPMDLEIKAESPICDLRIRLNDTLLDACATGRLQEVVEELATSRSRGSSMVPSPRGSCLASLEEELMICGSSVVLLPEQDIATNLSSLVRSLEQVVSPEEELASLFRSLEQEASPEEEPPATNLSSFVFSPEQELATNQPSLESFVLSPEQVSFFAPTSPDSPLAEPGPATTVQQICGAERRIGQLGTQIWEAEKLLVTKDTVCRHLEDRLKAARLSLAHVDLDAQVKQQKLDSAEKRQAELQAIHESLSSKLETLNSGIRQSLFHATPTKGLTKIGLSEMTGLAGSASSATIEVGFPQ